MNPSRRALLIVRRRHGARPAGGCSGLVPDPLVPDLLRNRVYDTSRGRRVVERGAADRAAGASARSLRCRRSSTTSSSAPSTSSGTPPIPHNGLVPDRCPTPSFVQHRRGRLRADRLRHRRRARLRHARRRRASARSPRCASSATRRRAPQARGMTGYKGFFYHFLDMKTGARFRTQRAVDRRHGAAAGRRAVRAVLLRRATTPTSSRSARWPTRIYRRVDWTWAQVRAPLDQHGLEAREGLHRRTTGAATTRRCWSYILALGSPTHPVGASAWSAWTESYRERGARFMGQEHLSFAPLFGHQYSHVWIDFRGIQDATCAARHRLLRELAAARRSRSAPTRSRTRRAGSTTAPTSGASPPATARGKLHDSTATDRALFLDYAARGAGR